ncbi:hypothetical protein BS17DRAFT_769152 [Gyrodon lividus]|nr:hypothetical protein BS17DRAFT_769152 [Gyrodon lividus]
MDLSRSQLNAIKWAQLILDSAGISPCELELLLQPSSRLSSHVSSRSCSPISCTPITPSPSVLASQYIPPPTRPFTPNELTNHVHKINRNQSVDAFIEHPPGTIVKYPQTGMLPGQGLKVCSAQPDTALNMQHSYTSWSSVHNLIAPSMFSYVDSATAKVFMKTLVLFCALSEHGCAFNASLISGTTATLSEPSSDPCIPTSSDAESDQESDTNFNMNLDNTPDPLPEYDLDYLWPLLKNNTSVIAMHEGVAREHGYGPLVLCSFVVSLSEQKQLCPHWHQFADGTLA